MGVLVFEFQVMRKDSARAKLAGWLEIAILRMRLRCWFPTGNGFPPESRDDRCSISARWFLAIPDSRRCMPRPDSSVVERGPEKAGVGGSIPSLATTLMFHSVASYTVNHTNC
jgi:hypothetical protein